MREPTLVLESKAKTYDGKRKASLKQESDAFWKASDSHNQIASDLEVLREPETTYERFEE
jgi:hypothetical protein